MATAPGRRSGASGLPVLDGLWEQTAPPPPATTRLRGKAECAVAVIGAGYTGLSAALHLAQSGHSVCLLEAGNVGQGGSGRNVGLVNAGMWLAPDDLEARLGPDLGPRLLSALAEGPSRVWRLIDRHAIDCAPVPNGTLQCAPDASGRRALEARHAQWRRRGAPVHLLDACETRARTGTDAFVAALLDARAGTIQPLAYARGLASAAIGAGAHVHCDSPVVAITRHGAAWRLDTPEGRLTAGAVIVATNTYSTAATGSLLHGQSVLPYFNIATAPLGAAQRACILPGGEGCWDTRKLLTSFRLDASGRLILGSVGALGRGDAPMHRAWARRRLRQLFPVLADLQFVQEWYGRIGNTPDAVPRFHVLGPRMWTICGYNGRGIAPGTVFGRMLAKLASAEIGPEAIPLPPLPARPDLLRHLRTPFWRAGAALWHLAAARVR